MTRIRHGDRIWEIHDDEWPRWVQHGWIPPDAVVLSERWTKGVWRRADSLEVYHLFRPTPGTEAPRLPVETNVRRHGPFGIFRGPGPSVTELLILANLLVGAFLYLRWGEDYSTHLWAYSARLMETLESGGIQVLLIPLFLHADVAHLSGNMLTFFLAGAVIEEFFGRVRMFAIYLGAGLSGAALSLMREKDVLSVGASGAILGMYGAGLVFLLRERGHFNASQRYRLKRVQIPFFLLLVIPAILHADFFAHLGGFLGGMVLGSILPPLPDRLPRRALEPSSEADAVDATTSERGPRPPVWPTLAPRQTPQGQGPTQAQAPTVGPTHVQAPTRSQGPTQAHPPTQAPAQAQGPGGEVTRPGGTPEEVHEESPQPEPEPPHPRSRIIPFPLEARFQLPPTESRDRSEVAGPELEGPDEGSTRGPGR